MLIIFHRLKTENVSLMRQSMEVPQQQRRGNTKFQCVAYQPHIHIVLSDGHGHKISSKAYPKMGQNVFKDSF